MSLGARVTTSFALSPVDPPPSSDRLEASPWLNQTCSAPQTMSSKLFVSQDTLPIALITAKMSSFWYVSRMER
jgi:hypothetical protein